MPGDPQRRRAGDAVIGIFGTIRLVAPSETQGTQSRFETEA
jgi:hypothetical protein